MRVDIQNIYKDVLVLGLRPINYDEACCGVGTMYLSGDIKFFVTYHGIMIPDYYIEFRK